MNSPTGIIKEELKGTVERVTFHSEESGYSVLRVIPVDRKNEQLTVTVHQGKVFAGGTFLFEGTYTEHPKYGQQFKAEKMLELKPASASALEKYLGSGLIYGVGPVTAKRIVKHFGEKTLDIFEEEMDRLQEVPGIASNKLETIRKSWLEHRSIRNVMMFLQEYGISTLYAVKIFKQYEHEAIEIVSANPYRLSRDIYGIGFFSADKIALSMGFAEDSPERVSAAIKHVLAASREEGHCYLLLGQILEQCIALLKLQGAEELIQQNLLSMEQENELRTRRLIKEGEEVIAYYSKTLYYDELTVVNELERLTKTKIKVDQKRVKNWLNRFNEKQPFPLSDEQTDSVAGVVGQSVSVLTGGPGCGKTTTTKAIVQLAVAMGRKVLLAAPTGRASQRMAEVIGREAQTIHRLLVFDPVQGGFKKGEEDPLEGDFIIVDECSMLDISLTASLLKAIPMGAQVLFIGDADQLPSVGAGNVLKDMMDSGRIPVFALTQIFRQGKESKIITYAHQINAGQIPKVKSPIQQKAYWKSEDCLFIDAEEATQPQAQFIKKIQKTMKSVLESGQTAVVKEADGHYQRVDKTEEDYYLENLEETELEQIRREGISKYTFNVPQQFMHVDVYQLLNSPSYADGLQKILKGVHPWSTLNYGFSASDMVVRLYAQTLPQMLGEGREIQVLTPMTKGSLGTRNLNMLIQQTANPAAENKPQITVGDRFFRVGDRVIQKRNNYDLEVFNGDIGKISTVNPVDFTMKINYGGRIVEYNREAIMELDLAYAITIHKSQGSEFDAVILPVATQHFKMLYRNLIYTGLTRAKKLAVFLGSRKSMGLAVKNVDNRKRQTCLKALIARMEVSE
ncbi:AAA family ATPase [Persicobacter sp. CCB-QB2]|uniref:SF1B family DNA helicase RecD2 n=1 Tax=Persicobacter sp. CCB-QB2 TaxID=1561025 RepID=UPI0006A98892|nr:AAA family ATPase [Persicobacter sp. CCB-QB2]